MSFKLKKIVERCDIFGQPITLRWKKRMKFKTFCGGSVSIFLMIFMIIFFLNGILFYINI